MIRFSFGHPDHGTSPVDQQCSQIGIATLADTKQGLLSATGVLSGNKAEPSGQLPAICEMLRVTDRSHQSTGGDRADARDLRQLPAILVCSVPRLNLNLQFADLVVKFLKMQALSLIHIFLHLWRLWP